MKSLGQLIIVVLLSGTQSSIGSLPSLELPSETKRAFDFLDKMLQPAEGCKGLHFAVAEMGQGGGFASQFQLSASSWIRTAAAFNYTIPVIIQGPIQGYTTAAECKHVDYQHTCVLLPMSSCQDELVASKLIDKASNKRFYANFDKRMVPAEFASLGLNWWWGIVQMRLFRIQPSVEEHIANKLLSLKEFNGYDFPFGLPVAGLHVRHGDKSSDGFRNQELFSQIKAIRKSSECVDKADFESELDNRIFAVLSNSTEGAVGADLNKNTLGSLAVFVASDDRKVLSASQRLGFLCFSEGGVSQNTSSEGMAQALSHNRAIAYNATLEIITDMYLLSSCSTLVGTVSSQIFRASASISRASGRLKSAIAMDYDRIQKVKGMSIKYHVPFPDFDSFLDSRSQ